MGAAALMLLISATLTGVRLQAAPKAPLGLTYSVSDDDPYISSVSSTVDWGDGSSSTTGPVAEPYGPITLAHAYSPGVYQVVVRAANFRTPVPDQAVFQQQVTVVSAQPGPPPAAPIAFGPILPSSQGFPSPDVWSFNLGRDGAILESSLTMLLLTRKGERVYNADYGTSIGRLIFALNTDELGPVVREEIARAVSANEPRVEFIGSNVSRSGRSMTVQAEFRSRLSGEPLVLNVGFAA